MMSAVESSPAAACGRLFFLLILWISPSLIRSSNDQSYQRPVCSGGDCGYGRHHLIEDEDCRDLVEACPGYARQGECFVNPGYMLDQCKRSCGICDQQRRDKGIPLEDDEDCTDKHSQCQLWANEKECFTNPVYMFQACPSSCSWCVNATDLRQKGIAEDVIQKRRNFSHTDFGEWQSIGDGADAVAVKERVKAMAAYAYNLENLGPASVCNNQDHDCAYWAVSEGSGCEKNFLWMLSHCSLACFYCDVIETYHKCRALTKDRIDTPFRDLASVYNHLILHWGAADLVNGKNSCNQGDANNEDKVCTLNIDGSQEEWVLSLDKKLLWKDEDSSRHGLEELVKFLKSKEADWVDVPQDEYDRSGELLTVDREQEPIVEDFVLALSDLLMTVPESHFEVEFVRYRRGHRFQSHKDGRLHDLWKDGGTRVLSIYIVLESPIKGGNFGFPELDWLLVEDPQILLWPNVKSFDPESSLERMKSEQLPVVKGQLYAALIWVHEYPYNKTSPCA
jgi:ShK domain-like